MKSFFDSWEEKKYQCPLSLKTILYPPEAMGLLSLSDKEDTTDKQKRGIQLKNPKINGVIRRSTEKKKVETPSAPFGSSGYAGLELMS